jgi:membrane protease YdiL (CAAX protease family)
VARIYLFREIANLLINNCRKPGYSGSPKPRSFFRPAGKPRYAGILAAVLVKRNAGLFQTTFQFVRFFDPSGFHDDFFSHFGPRDFMGMPLRGAWWILVYYAAVMLVCNIGGEELWWRGYVLPRQELVFGKAAWVVHGVFWSAFHLFMQPTLWDTFRMSITGLALSFVAQRTRSTWPGIVGHSFGNLTFFLSLVGGVTSP